MKTLINFKVVITLPKHTAIRRVLAVNKIEAISKIYATNYNIQEDISKYEAHAPFIGLVPH